MKKKVSIYSQRDSIMNRIFSRMKVLFVIFFTSLVSVSASTLIEESKLSNERKDFGTLSTADDGSAFGMMALQQQQKQITGNVTDTNGQSVPGVSVVVEGTTIGSITDANGNYTLPGVPEGATLVFSMVGLKNQEVVVRDQSHINVTLVEEVFGLDEVVAIGYGNVKRRDLTGATSSVSALELSQDRVVTSLEDALKGKVSGVRITQNSGGPGAGSTVMIRGATSVSGENEPLYVVDGFPMSSYDLNADDIATIDVLKDAASTAIYGSRGANGVIIVTTKKGQKGKPKIEVSAKYGFSDLATKVDVIDNVEWIKQIYEQGIRYTKESDFTGTMAGHLDYYQDTEGNIWTLPKFDSNGNPHPYQNHTAYRDSTNTDWQDAVLRKAILQDYRVSFSSGTDRSSYNLTLNMVDQEGLVPNNKVQRLLGRFNVSQKLTDRLQIISNTHFTKQKNQGFTGMIGQMLRRPQVQPLFGEWQTSNIPGYNEEGMITNPVEQTEVVDRDAYSSIFQSNLTLNYDITRKLALRVGGSYRNYAVDREFYTPNMVPGMGVNYKGVAEYSRNAIQNLTNENYLTYSESINDHDFTVMLGNSIEWSENKAFGVQNRGFELETLSFWGIEGGTEPQVPSVNYIETSLVSFYSRLNYSFRDKYLLNGTMRTDASSRFAENNKWGYFPSLGLAWRLSEEGFAKDIAWFPSTKIRATWGISGKQGIGPYQSLSVIGSGTGTINGVDRALVAYPVRLANPDLRWETNEEYNLGVDMHFEGGRYSVTADVYRKLTDGLLLALPTPGYTGYTSRTTNFGKLQNEGLEIQLNATPIQKQFRWSSSLNFTFSRSEVIEVGEQDRLFIPNGILMEGQPIGMWFGYEQDGIWQSQAEIDEAIANGFTGQHGVNASDIQPGHTRFKDQLTVDSNGDGVFDSGDGAIDANDRIGLGKSSPDVTGGFYNTFGWKGFSLNVGFQFSYGAKIFNSNRIDGEAGRGYANQFAQTADRWMPDLYSYDPENPSNMELLRPGNYSNSIRRVSGPVESQLVDRYIEDGSFIRLSDVSIAYDLPKVFVNRVGLTSCRIYVTGQNLRLWTEYTGYDPEVNTGQYRSLLPGLDSGTYPRERTIAFGLNVVL